MPTMCPLCRKPVAENQSGNDLYCSGHCPAPTLDDKLFLGTEQPGNGEVVWVECALCGGGRSVGARPVVVFDPVLMWMDGGGDDYQHNTGICRACTARAVRVWAATPEGFSATLEPRSSRGHVTPATLLSQVLNDCDIVLAGLRNGGARNAVAKVKARIAERLESVK